MKTQSKLVDGNTMIPDLLRSFPHARQVLDRYGLQGCGGQWGPMETLSFFSKAHDVPLDHLLSEIQVAIEVESNREQKSHVEEQPARLEDTIYRPFFKAGMAVILTLGAVWGAFLLLRIGLTGSFTAIGIHEVNAHGHAQIFGWVGLFVMGFAYQAFPRFKHTSLSYPKIAYATLWMMVAGLITRSVCEPLGSSYPVLWPMAIFASIVEIAAIILFVWIIVSTLMKTDKPFAIYDYYIVSSLVWFIIQAVYETVLFTATISAVSREELLNIIATWQAPLREIQIHGFAMLMILGVSQRIFHNFYGLPAPNEKKSLYALAGINLAIVGIIFGFILMRTQSHAWASLWYGSVLLLASSVIYLVTDWRIFSRAEDHDRNLKYIRSAYIWLYISLSMLVLLPLYQFVILPTFAPTGEAAEMGFSHAYYGSIRHAITVGFISLMIVGVAAKVVPTLNGIDMRALSALWLPFILINTGCAIRVIGQTLTDFSEAFFPIAGVSGLLEVSGIAVWAFHLLAIMAGKTVVKPAQDSTTQELQDGIPIMASHHVGPVLNRYPHLLNTFLDFGFKPLANPLLRSTLARTITIHKACKMMEVNENDLLTELNAQRKKHPKPMANTQPLYQISM